jgi:hypothetical protein
VRKTAFKRRLHFNVLNTGMSGDPGNDAGVHAVDLASWIEALYPAAASK